MEHGGSGRFGEGRELFLGHDPTTRIRALDCDAGKLRWEFEAEYTNKGGGMFEGLREWWQNRNYRRGCDIRELRRSIEDLRLEANRDRRAHQILEGQIWWDRNAKGYDGHWIHRTGSTCILFHGREHLHWGSAYSLAPPMEDIRLNKQYDYISLKKWLKQSR